MDVYYGHYGCILWMYIMDIMDGYYGCILWMDIMDIYHGTILNGILE